MKDHKLDLTNPEHLKRAARAYEQLARHILEETDATAIVLVLKEGVYGSCALSICPPEHVTEMQNACDAVRGAIGGNGGGDLVTAAVIDPHHTSRGEA